MIVKTLKELKQLPDEQKNCRLDFILESNSNDRFFEQLFCEDKPKEKKIRKWHRKGRAREKQLTEVLVNLPPYKECLYYIKSTSCHFNKLTLRVYGTKLIDDRLIHYVKKETIIPNNGSGSQLADYITNILSLFVSLASYLVLINVLKISFCFSITSSSILKKLKQCAR